MQTITTKDPILLKQYYDLREKDYRKKLGFEDYNGQENEYDKIGDVVVEVYEGKVIAGARIDFSNRVKSMYNENLEDGFSYKDVIKKFDPNFQGGEVYSEICGLVFDGSIKNHSFAKFFKGLLDYSENLNAKYVVGISYPGLLKILSVILSGLKHNFKVLDEIKIKPKSSYGANKFGLEFYPIVMKGL